MALLMIMAIVVPIIESLVGPGGSRERIAPVVAEVALYPIVITLMIRRVVRSRVLARISR